MRITRYNERFEGKEKMRCTAGATLGRWASLRLWIFFLVGLSGCMQPISKDVMATVDPGRTFAVVIENPKAYIGSVVLWGGVVEKYIPGPGQTRLLVEQYPVDAKGRPQMDATYGEFVVHTPDRLDPLLFREGMVITLAGMLDGVEEAEDGPQKMLRPVVRLIEIHAWSERGGSLGRR